MKSWREEAKAYLEKLGGQIQRKLKSVAVHEEVPQAKKKWYAGRVKEQCNV
jgi:hypothetical protein